MAGLDDSNGSFATPESARKQEVEAVERVNEMDSDEAKDGVEVIDFDEEKRLVRKLDLWFDRNRLRRKMLG